MSEEVPFTDILEPRKTQTGIWKFMSREWDPQKSYVLDKCYSPQDLKDLVAKSVYMDSVIEAESVRTGVSKEKLRRQVLEFLEEMGLDKRLFVIRWMGVVFLKICFMMKVGVFVNQPAVLKVRSSMGSNPVLFLPTHRSYADFCLMTYLCYHYDIDFPAVAAGMDFYSMAVVGRRMRETCAFYIRRTLAGAPLYAATLRQYVRTLVAKHSAPVEFFLEGTRSRSNKSLPPKYGMLSMTLMPYFAREVSDVTIVPVNISYDRLMETALFAYEHLGVPKPKESTGGLLKALHSLNDHFGNIYINVGNPVSVKEYLQHSDATSNESLKPVDLQQLTTEQFSQVQDLANYVITLQQECTVVTISNLLALVLMQSLIRNQPLSVEETVQEIEWMIRVLRGLGASVFENDVRSSVEKILVVHRGMVAVDAGGRLRVRGGAHTTVTDDVKRKMKGHTLRAETMSLAVSVIQLQLYVNPALHYLAPPALVLHAAGGGGGGATREQLTEDYHHLRKLLKYEIFHIEKNEEATLAAALSHCLETGVVVWAGGALRAGGNTRAQSLLRAAIHPALHTLAHCTTELAQMGRCTHSEALKRVQAAVEARAGSHPYCLSLDCIGNCLQGLVAGGALARLTSESEVTYVVDEVALARSASLVHRILSSAAPHADFGHDNIVLLHHKDGRAKL